MRINFSVDGARGVKLPKYAMLRDEDNVYQGRIDAAARAVARANRMQVLTTRLDHWSSVSSCYQVSLGRPAYGGGWSIDAQIWVYLPVTTTVGRDFLGNRDNDCDIEGY